MTFILADLERRYGNFFTPDFLIEVDQENLLKHGAEISGVTVDHILEGADQFSFSVNNPYDPGKSDFTWSEDGLFEVGRKVNIKMGYAAGAKAGMEILMEGIITSLKLSFPNSGTSQLDVSGYDYSHLMMKGKRSLSWNDKKDSDIVKQVAGRYSLSPANVEDSIVIHPQTKQDKESDFDFLKKLAERCGFEFFVFRQELYFRKPARNEEPLLDLHWGRTLFSFTPEISITEQITDVRVLGWDPAAKKEIVGLASKGQEEKKRKGQKSGSEIMGEVVSEKVVEEVHCPVYSQAQADALARAILNRRSEELVKGSGECIGLPILRPGQNIRIGGLGKRFSKEYYVEKTTHSIGSSGYRTTFNVKDISI